ncbi:hypothetical protein HF521_012690 [Silurus meridionalis]|uniref:Uncharacterized protein n=1 Tax=Silurus meridionalis TaxID=175797 RepID=A0A8T0AB38_SILME|nr:hypothetical protein HF521_012690 [Silurus meridionalis]
MESAWVQQEAVSNYILSMSSPLPVPSFPVTAQLDNDESQGRDHEEDPHRYMKRFRKHKWKTFFKCYQDTHRPLFGDGWDKGSDSSGRSSPKIREVVKSSDPQLSSSESTGQRRAGHRHHGAQLTTCRAPGETETPRSKPSFPQREPDTDECTDFTLRKATRVKSQLLAGAAERTSKLITHAQISAMTGPRGAWKPGNGGGST